MGSAGISLPVIGRRCEMQHGMSKAGNSPEAIRDVQIPIHRRDAPQSQVGTALRLSTKAHYPVMRP
jgi:hypothetical protein